MSEDLIVTEGISGVYHYHLSHASRFTRGLCGRQTMRTGLSLLQWGGRSDHLHETYCKKCEERAESFGVVLPKIFDSGDKK